MEAGRAWVYLEFWNEAGSRISSSFHETRLPGFWHAVMLSGEAPEGATHATLLLYSPQSNRGTAWFDDAAIEQVHTLPVEQFGTAAFTAAIRGGSLLGDRLFVTSRHAVDGRLRLAEGDGGGYGGLGAHLGNVYLHNIWGSSIQQLSLEGGGSDAVLYDDLPDGWYNRP